MVFPLTVSDAALKNKRDFRHGAGCSSYDATFECSLGVVDWPGGLGLAIERPVVGAGAEVRAFGVSGAEGPPCAGSEDAVVGHVVHVNRDA